MSEATIGADDVDVAASAPGQIAGERRTAIVARSFASLQSKVQNALALGVVLLLGGGFLVWYYTGVAETRAQAAAPAKPATVQGEMRLPPLGPAPVRPSYVSQSPVTEESLGMVGAEDLNGSMVDDGNVEGSGQPLAAGPAAAASQVPDPELQRRLEAPVLIRGTGSYAASGESDPEVGTDGRGATYSGHPWPSPVGPAFGGSEIVSAISVNGQPGGRPPAGGSPGSSGAGLAGMLQPTRTEAVAAGVMPERRFLLSKGSFIDCTLETAIDSSLPGMTTCITATDVWSADGSVVLLERGTKLVGETRGDVRQGQERLFVLWSEARTPAGVVVELASPGTDELGRSGVTGAVDTHFAARFGAAILISLIDVGTAALVAAQSDGGSSVVIAPQGASDVVSEVLRQTVDIPPTIRVAQGGRMQVLVARDVSFAAVYSLARR